MNLPAYKCPQGSCQWNVPADTGGCVCNMPKHTQDALKQAKELSDWLELKRIGKILEDELAIELAKRVPDQARVARIEKLAGVPLR